MGINAEVVKKDLAAVPSPTRDPGVPQFRFAVGDKVKVRNGVRGEIVAREFGAHTWQPTRDHRPEPIASYAIKSEDDSGMPAVERHIESMIDPETPAKA